MLTALVMPCLNEELHLAKSCATLGFGAHFGLDACDVRLVLVDNGSTDRTVAVMESIRAQSPDGSVIIVHEPTRGYVPARHRGVLAAQDAASRAGHSDEAVLVLQVDADSTFATGYISAMVAAARSLPRNVVLEGSSQPPREFVEQNLGYELLAQETYLAARPLICEDSDDVVVGDSVSAFWLSDYFAWGGHRREYAASGEELHAETSRLFMRGKSRGASHHHVAHAEASHSRRKAYADPIRFFALAGFPREARRLAPSQAGANVNVLAGFDRLDARFLYAEAITTRICHLVGLFGLLPAYVARTLGNRQSSPARAGIQFLLGHLPHEDPRTVAEQPGKLLEKVLRLIDERPELFRSALETGN